jgi:hypothetical protein
MKLWAKTIGLFPILYISLATALLNHYFGDGKVFLPTLVSGIRFVETPVTHLLAAVLPTVVYFNRSKLAHFRSEKRFTVFLSEIMTFPLAVTLGIVFTYLLPGSVDASKSFIFSSMLFGLSSELIFYFKPWIAICTPFFTLVLFHIFDLHFMYS